MKTVKKSVALVMAVLMMSMMLVGCGGVEGKYKLKTAEMNGQTIPVAMVGEMTLELKSGGKAKMSMSAMGQSQETEGTWEKKGSDKVAITIDGEAQEATIKGKKLIIEAEGMKMTFEK